MDITEKTRVLKLIGMLGSAFDGERANAAAMLGRMAEARRLTINELMAEAHGAPSYNSPPPPPPPPRQKHPFINPDDDFTDIDKADDLLRMLRRIADNVPIASRVLTDWEINFSIDVGGRYRADYELSEKQLVIVEKILRKAQRVFP